VPAGQAQSTTVTVNVSNPALWSTESPSLYTVRTELSAGGTVVDVTTIPFGIRYFGFDPPARASHSTASR